MGTFFQVDKKRKKKSKKSTMFYYFQLAGILHFNFWSSLYRQLAVVTEEECRLKILISLFTKFSLLLGRKTVIINTKCAYFL